MQTQKKPFELVWMPVVDFIKLKPFSDQSKNGKSLIKEARVKKLMSNINRILSNPKVPILTNDNKILSGNHRQRALDLTHQQVPFGHDAVIPVLKYTIKVTPSMESVIAIDGNLAGNTSNAKVHLRKSKTQVSVKVLNPACEAFDRIALKLSGENAEHLGIRLGSVINKNPKTLDSLIADKPMDVSMIDLYEAKGNGDTALRGLVDIEYDEDGHVQVDLRNHVDKLVVAIFLGVKLIHKLQDKGLWKEKLGNNRMLMYYILELSLAKRIVEAGRASDGKVTFRHFETILKTKGAEVYKAASTINADPAKSRDTLERLFFT